MENNSSELITTSKYRCLIYHESLFEDLYLTSCGIEQCIPGKKARFDDRPGYHLHIVMMGKGKLYVNDKPIEIQKNMMFMCKPHEKQVYVADQDDPWLYCWMTFDGKKAEYLAESAGFSKDVYVQSSSIEAAKFIKLVDKVLDNPGLSDANDMLRLSLLLSYIRLATDSNVKTIGTQKRYKAYDHEGYVQYALDYIHGNYMTVKVNDIAKVIGIHRSYLTSIFKKETGLSPQEYILQYRMKQAETLLISTSLSVQEISRRVGYDDPLTFSKMFKGAYGQSPKHYREFQKGNTGDL